MRHFFSAIVLCFFLISCDRFETISKDGLSVDAKNACDSFNKFAKHCTIDESFLFFTDPHLVGTLDVFDLAVQNHMKESFGVAKEIFDALPLSFCLCGGDWLRSGDTQETAKKKLLFADGYMKYLFYPYYKMMGNHDTNYQGVVSTENNERGDLPRDFIDNEYFSETGSAYYSFSGASTRFFVIDSGLDWTTSMDEYRWEQIIWLANQLLEIECEHMALCLHMFRIDNITPMSKLIVELIDAYNTNKSIALNGKDYDYSNAKGKLHFILSGHNHEDSIIYVGDNNNIPVIQTCNYTKDGTNSFDVCVVDYNESVLNLIRVGYGRDREIRLFI